MGFEGLKQVRDKQNMRFWSMSSPAKASSAKYKSRMATKKGLLESSHHKHTLGRATIGIGQLKVKILKMNSLGHYCQPSWALRNQTIVRTSRLNNKAYGDGCQLK